MLRIKIIFDFFWELNIFPYRFLKADMEMYVGKYYHLEQ